MFSINHGVDELSNAEFGYNSCKIFRWKLPIDLHSQKKATRLCTELPVLCWIATVLEGLSETICITPAIDRISLTLSPLHTSGTGQHAASVVPFMGPYSSFTLLW